MQAAIPHKLWLGNAQEAREVAAVLGLGITAIVDLAAEAPPIQYPRDIAYCRLPLVDGAGNRPELIRAAIDLIATLLDAQVPTLVACGAGMSRSPAIAAAAVAKSRHVTLQAALELITTDQPHDLSTSLWAEIQTVCAR